MIDKSYVEKYLDKAIATTNESLKKDCLYRIGTHMEIIECDGDSDLSDREQNQIFYQATNLLHGKH